MITSTRRAQISAKATDPAKRAYITMEKSFIKFLDRDPNSDELQNIMAYSIVHDVVHEDPMGRPSFYVKL